MTFAANDICNAIALVGDYKKTANDLTFGDLQAFVTQTTELEFYERTLRRMIRGLGIQKSPGGYYSRADATVIVGWVKRRDRYFSYGEYMQSEGRAIYAKAQNFWS